MATGQWPDGLPRDDPWTPCLGTPTLAVNSSLAWGPPFSEAEARGFWTTSAPLTATHARLGHAVRLRDYSKATEADSSPPGTPRGPLSVSPGSPSWGGPWQLRGTLCPLAKLALPPLHRRACCLSPLPWLCPCLVSPISLSPFNAPVRLHAPLSRKLPGLPHMGCLPLGRPLLPDHIPWQCLSWLQV